MQESRFTDNVDVNFKDKTVTSIGDLQRFLSIILVDKCGKRFWQESTIVIFYLNVNKLFQKNLKVLL